MALFWTLFRYGNTQGSVNSVTGSNTDSDYKNLKGGPANHFVGMVSDGGHLYLSKDALIFHPHAFNLHHDDVKIKYSNIIDVKSAPVLNQILVDTRNGETHKFAVYHKDKWISDIKRMME